MEHARFWKKINFQSIPQVTGEISQLLSIQKVPPRAGIKLIDAVCCQALWKPGLLKDGSALKMEIH